MFGVTQEQTSKNMCLEEIELQSQNMLDILMSSKIYKGGGYVVSLDLLTILY